MFARKTEIHIHSLSPMLSKAIKQCRLALNMSQEQFSCKIRKPLMFVQDLEQTKVAITSQTLEDCAAVFGLSVGELVEIAVSDRAVVVVKTAPAMRAAEQVLS